jgi:hypothetical protein
LERGFNDSFWIVNDNVQRERSVPSTVARFNNNENGGHDGPKTQSSTMHDI